MVRCTAMPPKNRQPDARQAPVQVLGKVAALLDHLARERELTAAQLADLLEEPRSTVYRLLSSLQACGFVEAGAPRGTYRLGLGLLRLGSAVLDRFDVRQTALPVMERLHEERGETTFLCIRRGYEAVCIERIEGRWVQSMALLLGGSLPLHIGAAPRALLAFETPEFIEHYLEHATLSQLTPLTPASADEVRTLLEETRQLGYVVSCEDVVPGMAAVGAPIFDHAGAIHAAISMSGPRPMILGDNANTSFGLIAEAGRTISRGLGWQPDAARHRAAAPPPDATTLVSTAT